MQVLLHAERHIGRHGSLPTDNALEMVILISGPAHKKRLRVTLTLSLDDSTGIQTNPECGTCYKVTSDPLRNR